jgi:hypothetical protein
MTVHADRGAAFVIGPPRGHDRSPAARLAQECTGVDTLVQVGSSSGATDRLGA